MRTPDDFLDFMKIYYVVDATYEEDKYEKGNYIFTIKTNLQELEDINEDFFKNKGKIIDGVLVAEMFFGEQEQDSDYYYKKGGYMKRKRYTYIPNSEIESLTTWNGKEIKGSQLLDGAYARGNVKYNDGGILDKRRGELNSYSDERIARIYSDLKELDYSDVIIEIKGNRRERQDAINEIMKEIEKREMADGGMMAKGGITKIEVGDEIKFVFKVPTILEIYESDDTELNEPIEETYKPSEILTADIFGVDENKIDIQFGDGSVAFVRLKDIEIVSINDIKYSLGGKMASGGATMRRKLSLEEKAENMVGSSTWHSLDRETKAGVISELITEELIPMVIMAKGSSVKEKFEVTFVLSNGEKVKQTYKSKDDMDEGISEFYIANDVVEAIIEEEKKETSIFETAKKAEPKSKTAKQKKGVYVEGIESEIQRYDELKAIINNAKAEQELIGGRLKEVGKTKFLELYEYMKSKPDNFNLEDGDEKIMFIVMDKYKKVEPEKEELLEDYPDLLEKVTTYSFNPEVLERVGGVINKLIQNSKEISDEDKSKLLIVDTSVAIKKGSIDNLMKYDNPEEIFNLIEPILALK